MLKLILTPLGNSVECEMIGHKSSWLYFKILQNRFKTAWIFPVPINAKNKLRFRYLIFFLILALNYPKLHTILYLYTHVDKSRELSS